MIPRGPIRLDIGVSTRGICLSCSRNRTRGYQEDAGCDNWPCMSVCTWYWFVCVVMLMLMAMVSNTSSDMYSINLPPFSMSNTDGTKTFLNGTLV